MDSQQFINICKKLVSEYTNKNSGIVNNTEPIKPEDVYVVWSTKVLQNNKALLSTPLSDGMYYEITFNGLKNGIYFDAYKKLENIVYDV